VLVHHAVHHGEPLPVGTQWLPDGRSVPEFCVHGGEGGASS
jgi:hypothetical protein